MKIIKVFCLLLCSFAFSSQAALTWAGWPAPGGNDFTGSGTSPAHAGGKTYDIFNFTPSAYDQLYYGVSPDYLPQMGENGLEAMTFDAGASDLANGLLVWTNTFNVFNAMSNAFQLVSGSFVFTFTDLANNALGLVSAASLGLDPEQGGYLNVTGDYRINWQFNINGTAAMPWYDSFANDPQARLDTSIGSGFYYTPAQSNPIPEPSGIALMGLIFAALGLRRVFR